MHSVFEFFCNDVKISYEKLEEKVCLFFFFLQYEIENERERMSQRQEDVHTLRDSHDKMIDLHSGILRVLVAGRGRSYVFCFFLFNLSGQGSCFIAKEVGVGSEFLLFPLLKVWVGAPIKFLSLPQRGASKENFFFFLLMYIGEKDKKTK